MGIRLNISNTYKTTVKYTIIDENGKEEKQEFLAEFKRRDQEECKTMIASGKLDAEHVRDVLVGWKCTDLVTGQDIPYSEAMRDALLAQTGVGGTIMQRYLETVGAVRPKT